MATKAKARTITVTKVPGGKPVSVEVTDDMTYGQLITKSKVKLPDGFNVKANGRKVDLSNKIGSTITKVQLVKAAAGN